MIEFVPIQSNDFTDKLLRYMEEEKPDPQQKRQMEGWKMEWHNNQQSFSKFAMDHKEIIKIILPANHFEPTHAITGTLNWTGEYMMVTITSHCYWCGEEKNNMDGSMFFQCTVTARFRESDLLLVHGKESKIQDKMTQRLRQDDYIAKILQPQPLLLCQTLVVMVGTNGNSDNANQHLEERVHCNEEVAEAIRRALYNTSSNGPIDIFELIGQFPFLPSTTVLAQRSRLRLLEDAMYDACEKEGENEIVQDLNLQNSDNKKINNKESQPNQKRRKG